MAIAGATSGDVINPVAPGDFEREIIEGLDHGDIASGVKKDGKLDELPDWLHLLGKYLKI